MSNTDSNQAAHDRIIGSGQARTPDQVMADFTAAVTGTADIDPYDILWEVIADVSGSYELAMRHEGINPDTIGNISNTVGDYLSNAYGDEDEDEGYVWNPMEHRATKGFCAKCGGACEYS